MSRNITHSPPNKTLQNTSLLSDNFVLTKSCYRTVSILWTPAVDYNGSIVYNGNARGQIETDPTKLHLVHYSSQFCLFPVLSTATVLYSAQHSV